jgi:hypothetical protein
MLTVLPLFVPVNVTVSKLVEGQVITLVVVVAVPDDVDVVVTGSVVATLCTAGSVIDVATLFVTTEVVTGVPLVVVVEPSL